MAKAKSTDKLATARDSLPLEFRGAFDLLVEDYKTAAEAHTGQVWVNYNILVEDEHFPFPAVSEQKRIVAQLDSLADETQRLERLYEQKQAALDTLKKSFLQQAFTGGL